MEERILIKSSRYKFSTALIVITVLFLLAFIISTTININMNYTHNSSLFDEFKRTYEGHSASGGCGFHYGDGKYCYDCSMIIQHPTKLGFLLSRSAWDGLLLICFGGAIFISIIVYFLFYTNEITVTDKRVFGRTIFGKRVDLPIDSISAVGTSWPKGVAAATSSGKVAFLMIKNRDEIHKCVSNLLIERQNKAPAQTVVRQEVSTSNADELKKYKDLLDSGIITQEEFDAKKKQLLGL